MKFKLYVGAIEIIFLLPLIMYKLNEKNIVRFSSDKIKSNKGVLIAGVIYLAVLVGGIFPLSVIVESP